MIVDVDLGNDYIHYGQGTATQAFEDFSTGGLKQYNENDLLLIRESSTVWVPCTKSLSMFRLWIWISWASNDQEQLVEAENPINPKGWNCKL